MRDRNLLVLRDAYQSYDARGLFHSSKTCINSWCMSAIA
jgi:hypothetical protein